MKCGMDEIGNEDSFVDALSEAWNGIHTCRRYREDIHSVAEIAWSESLYDKSRKNSNLSLHSIFSVTVFWIDSDVIEFVYRPSESLSMELGEAWPFKFIANNCYGRRKVASEFMKTRNGE